MKGDIYISKYYIWKINILNPKVIEVFGSNNFPLSNWIRCLVRVFLAIKCSTRCICLNLAFDSLPAIYPPEPAARCPSCDVDHGIRTKVHWQDPSVKALDESTVNPSHPRFFKHLQVDSKVFFGNAKFCYKNFSY